MPFLCPEESAETVADRSPGSREELVSKLREAAEHARNKARSAGVADAPFALAKSSTHLRDRHGLSELVEAVRSLDLVPEPDLERFRAKAAEASAWGVDATACQVHAATVRARRTPHRWGEALADGRRAGARRLAAFLEILAWSGDGTVSGGSESLSRLLGVPARSIRRHRGLLVELGLLEDLGAEPGEKPRFRWHAAPDRDETPVVEAETGSVRESDRGPDHPLPLSIERTGGPRAAGFSRGPEGGPATATEDAVISIPTVGGSFDVQPALLARWKGRWPDRDVRAILEDARDKAELRPIRDGRRWCLSFLRRDYVHRYEDLQNVLPFPVPEAAGCDPDHRELVLLTERLSERAETLDDPRADRLLGQIRSTWSLTSRDEMTEALELLERHHFRGAPPDPRLEELLARAAAATERQEALVRRRSELDGALSRRFLELRTQDPAAAEELRLAIERLRSSSDDAATVAGRAAELLARYGEG